MRSSFLLRLLALTTAFSAPFLGMSCQELPLFPIPEDGGETTSTTGSTTGSTTASTTAGTGGMGGSATTSTTAGTGGRGGMGAGGSGGTAGAGGAGVGGSGGAGGSAAGTGGAGGMIASDAGSDASRGTTSGVGSAGGAAEDAGAGDAEADGASPEDAGAPDAPDDGSMVSDAGTDGGACVTSNLAFPLEPGIHVMTCSPISWPSNPPTSGLHYGVWAAFKTYAAPVPRGFLVHALEHGGVVFTYNCPDGCAADIAALQAMLDARPADPQCVAPLKNRFIISPDPLLDSRFAASAWGFAAKAECMDVAAMSGFIDAHYAKAPEDFCFDGTDVLAPGYNLPPDCGQPPVADAGSD